MAIEDAAVSSRVPGASRLRLVEAKSRTEGSEAVTVAPNENMPAIKKPKDDILAVVMTVDAVLNLHHPRRPFRCEPDFALMSFHGSLVELLVREERPR